MTVVARRDELVRVLPAGLHRIDGTLADVDTQIVAYRQAGRLRKKTRTVPIAGEPGVFVAYVVLSAPAGKTLPRLVAAFVGVALLAVVLAVWWVVANWTAILGALTGLAGLVVGALILRALSSRGCHITVIHRRG
jgi:hypothetical protein